MEVVETVAALRSLREKMNGSVGLVPTMGALHAGHRALLNAARAENARVIATIFVNPTQFGPGEDLNTYPRTLSADLEIMEADGADFVFVPSSEVMYTPDFSTSVSVDGITRILEGERRPSHFRGVTTIVAKLFNLAQPTRAYFGQKDAQQVAVLRQMVRDLNFALDIVVIPTVRESSGLAMSSRNAYLDPEQREMASVLYRALVQAATSFDEGEHDAENLRLEAMDILNSEELVSADYVDVLDARTFKPIGEAATAPLIILLAAQVGKTRLLDNALLPWALNSREGLNRTLGAGAS